MLRTTSSVWSISGNGNSYEKRFFGLWFFWRQRKQEWSPNLTEVEIEHGIRFKHMRISFSRTFNHFHDGKDPKIVRKL